MGFYEDFIDKYDKLISWDNRAQRETEFFRDLFAAHKVKTVLDCACGTGQHVIMFHKMGLSAVGSDLSPAMIRKARLNARRHGVKPSFQVADFRSLSKTFHEKFDAVISVGNSLPHLLNDRDLALALKEMHRLLHDGGILILQQRNYDMLTDQQKRFIPITFREGEMFFYVLDYLKGKIVFNVVDVEPATNSFRVFSAEYNPLKRAHLRKLLLESGFRRIKCFGNFKLKKPDIRKDDYLIVTCEK